MTIKLVDHARVARDAANAMKKLYSEKEEQARHKYFNDQFKELTDEIMAVANRGESRYDKVFSNHKYADDAFLSKMVSRLKEEGFSANEVENLSIDKVWISITIRW